MLTRMTATFLALSLAGAAGAFQEARRWIKLSPPDGRFTVLMPGKPSSETRRSELGVDYSFMADTDSATYEVGYSLHAAAFPSPEAALDVLRDALTLASRGRLEGETRITLDGFPGREIRLSLLGGTIKDTTRLYVVGDRVYRLRAVVGPPGGAVSRDVNKFFSSFKLAGVSGRSGKLAALGATPHFLIGRRLPLETSSAAG
jgi:hypothetical protein